MHTAFLFDVHSIESRFPLLISQENVLRKQLLLQYKLSLTELTWGLVRTWRWPNAHKRARWAEVVGQRLSNTIIALLLVIEAKNPEDQSETSK